MLRLRFLSDTIKYQDLGHKSPDFFLFFFGGVPDENPGIRCFGPAAILFLVFTERRLEGPLFRNDRKEREGPQASLWCYVIKNLFLWTESKVRSILRWGC